MKENPLNQASENLPHAAAPLTVLALYQDAETRGVAQSLCSHLVKELEHDFDFDCTWCGLDDLSDPELARNATVVATEADLVMFTVRGGTSPSGALKAWVDTWLGLKEAHESALVMMVAEDTNKKRTTPFHTYLKDAALEGKMDFLPHVIRIDSSSEAEITAGSIGNHGGRRPALLS